MQPTNDYEEVNLEYCRAGSGKRFANYLIDMIAFYIVVIFLGFITEIVFPGSISENSIDGITERIIGILLYGLVMFIVEAAFQGKSLGKFITRTRAVNVDGEPPSFSQLLGRNFVRAVPFNALSALGSPCVPWHDRWSDTYVIDEKVLELQQRKKVFFSELGNQEAD